ncbi:MAG: signal transduction histidine kinase [Sulfurimonas sp.]|jgi:signal transduction histidine kinase
MYRFILLFLLLFTYRLSALDITPDEVPIHKSIDISQNITTIKEAINNPQKFKNVKYFRRYLRKKKDNNNLWLKLPLTNTTDVPLPRELVMRWDRANVNVYLVEDGHIIYEEILDKGKYHCVSSKMAIPASKTIDLYLHVKVSKPIDDFYYLYMTSPLETKDLIIHKEKFYHNGFFLGILLTMMLHSFFMYFSIRVKSYLYLALYQLSIIFYVSDLRLLMINLLEDVPDFSYFLLKIGSNFFIVLFSVLFTQEFLNTKQEMPQLHFLLKLSFIVLLFYQYYGSATNYATLMYILYIIAGVYALWKGNSSALFYVLGFSGFVIFIIGINIIKFFELNIYFEYKTSIQIFGSIEALALSIALYLKLKSIVKEKEKAQIDSVRNEKMLLEQSRFASMGEMIASIAHQWRQPLNHLNLIFNNLRFAEQANKLDSHYLELKAKEAEQQLKYMSSTVEDFSNFFATKGKEEKFLIKEVCEYAVELVKSRFKKNQILLSMEGNDSCSHYNYKNEIVQVLTVLLNNSIDALMSNNVEDRHILISITCNEISIEDNAGGIPTDVLPKIFDPYFSTKDKKFGTGMGLYTARIIVRDLIKGKLIAQNTRNGVKLTLTIS